MDPRSALPCESPPPLGEEREVDALRRGREEREMRAELEGQIEQQRRRLRGHVDTSPAANTAGERMTRSRTKRREQLKEEEQKEEEGEAQGGGMSEEEEEDMAGPRPASVILPVTSVEGLTSSLRSITLTHGTSSSVVTSASVTAGGGGVRRGVGSPSPLPSVIEESFLASSGVCEGGLSWSPTLYVDKWVDYSSKYGLGYLLSDGRVGVYFNDASKAILHSSNSSAFTYVERRTKEEGGGEEVEVMDLSDHPPALHKKVTLLKHFSKYLTQRATPPSSTPSSSSPSSLPYVRKWLRTKHAIFFRLSCGSVQVIFNDRTELVVGEGRVAYTDRGGRRMGGLMEEVEGRKDEGLGKRLRYMRDILQHINTKQSQTPSTTANALPFSREDGEDRKGKGKSRR